MSIAEQLRQEGWQSRNIELAKRMLVELIPIDKVQKVTGISIQELKKLFKS